MKGFDVAQRDDDGGHAVRSFWTHGALGFSSVIAISDTERFARHCPARPRRCRGGAGRRILLRSGHPPATAARGGTVRAMQLQLAQQACIADNLAIGRGTPMIVGPSLNAPLLDHPEALASLRKLPT
jgi:hypothetical protein